MENRRVLIISWLNEKSIHHDKNEALMSCLINDITYHILTLVVINNNVWISSY